MEFWFSNCCLFEQSEKNTISIPCGQTRHNSEIELQQTASGKAPHPNSYLPAEISNSSVGNSSNSFSIKICNLATLYCLFLNIYLWFAPCKLNLLLSKSISKSPFKSHHSPVLLQQLSRTTCPFKRANLLPGNLQLHVFFFGMPLFSQVIGIYKIEFLIF